MTWKTPIKSISYNALEDETIRETLASTAGEFLWEGTVLLKDKRKVVAVCEMEEVWRSGIIMCSYEDVKFALKAIKIRRPKRLYQLMGCEIDQETMRIMSWVDCWNL